MPFLHEDDQWLNRAWFHNNTFIWVDNTNMAADALLVILRLSLLKDSIGKRMASVVSCNFGSRILTWKGEFPRSLCLITLLFHVPKSSLFCTLMVSISITIEKDHYPWSKCQDLWVFLKKYDSSSSSILMYFPTRKANIFLSCCARQVNGSKVRIQNFSLARVIVDRWPSILNDYNSDVINTKLNNVKNSSIFI